MPIAQMNYESSHTCKYHFAYLNLVSGQQIGVGVDPLSLIPWDETQWLCREGSQHGKASSIPTRVSSRSIKTSSNERTATRM